MDNGNNILILGVGNILMGDEGVGVQAVTQLATEKFPDHVKIIDGGTGGFHLLEYFQDYDPIILIDATMDGKPAGTVTVTYPKFAADFPKTLSAHDIGLRDLLESAALIGTLPRMILITVAIESLQSMAIALSPPVKDALPRVTAAVRSVLAEVHPI